MNPEGELLNLNSCLTIDCALNMTNEGSFGITNYLKTYTPMFTKVWRKLIKNLNSDGQNETFLHNSDKVYYLGYSKDEEPSVLATTMVVLFSSIIVVSFFFGKRISSSYSRILKLLKTGIEDVIIVLFSCIFLLICSVPYGAMLVIRWTVDFVGKLWWGELCMLVEGTDSAGVVDVPTNLQIIKSLKILRGPSNVEYLRERCLKTVSRKNDQGQLVFPKFFQKLSTFMGFYCWKPSDFDMEHHFRIVDKEDVNGRDLRQEAVTESEALEIVSRVANKPFAEGRSNWEILLIPHLIFDHELDKREEERVDKFGLIIRVHHGIGDGFSLMKLIMRDMADRESHYVPPKQSSMTKEKSWLYKVGVFLYVLFKTPRTIIKELMLRDVNPLHNDKLQITGEKTLLWSKPINIQWLKVLKNEIGSGMSAMLLAALTSAVKKYMVVKCQVSEDELPSNISAIIPSPAPHHPDDKMCNKFSAIMFPLDIKSKCSLDRCKSIVREGKKIASSPDAPANLFFMNLCGVAPTPMADYFIGNTQNTLLISNVPGPDRRMNIWGSQLLDTIFWLPNLGNSGISISMLSYYNHMRVGIAADNGVIKDGAEGAHYILDSMIEYLQEMSLSVNVPAENVIVSADDLQSSFQEPTEPLTSKILPAKETQADIQSKSQSKFIAKSKSLIDTVTHDSKDLGKRVAKNHCRSYSRSITSIIQTFGS